MADTYTIRYMTSLLAFYIKSELSFSRNLIYFKKPNTVLKFIPVGADNSSLPVTQVSSVSSSFRFVLKDFLIGVVLACLGLFYRPEGATFAQSFLVALIFLLVAAALIIRAFDTDLSIKTTSGQSIDISFYVFEKQKAYDAERIINALISERLDDTNMSDQTDRLVDAINGLRK